MKRILIAEDHHVVTFAVSLMLKNHFQDIVVDYAEDYEAAKEKIGQEQYDLLILDIEIPGSIYVGMITELKAIQEKMLIMVFTAYEDDRALPYIKAGAHGYLNKKCSHEKILRAIDCIMKEGYYYPFKIISAAIQLSTPKKTVQDLSEREFQIFELLAQGEGMNEITMLLNISHSTASTHKKRIYEKLGIKNLIELSKIYDSLK
ncbi:response regulator transcription factor [Chryseobacterium endophyticum]|uniref:Response regulator transcription factor n=1 Tax=Chryseobacterium endophyticum TaxID=1854762 RepID=A0AAU6WP12_9FLAO|nr:response regulator transcription factor [uncultured Chryseobacterium sp.]